MGQGPKHSSSERFLRGRVLSAEGMPESPVRSVTKVDSNRRVIYFENGTKKTVTQKQLFLALQSTLANQERARAETTLRPTLDGKYEAKIGGLKQGTVRKYNNRESAIAAMNRHHNLSDQAQQATKSGKPTLPRFQEVLARVRDMQNRPGRRPKK